MAWIAEKGDISYFWGGLYFYNAIADDGLRMLNSSSSMGQVGWKLIFSTLSCIQVSSIDVK